MLNTITQDILGCNSCLLRRSCRQPVPGTGNPEAEVMLIGEGPGEHEDEQGLPFVGPSGQLLRELITAAGLDIEDMYLANVIKCRPPFNRDPSAHEIKTCLPFLDAQIKAINPKLILALGRYAMVQFMPDGLITKLHGRPQIVHGRVVVPIIHPAAALRRPEWKPIILQDLRLIPRLLNTPIPTNTGKLTIL